MVRKPGFLKHWRSAWRGDCVQCGEKCSPRETGEKICEAMSIAFRQANVNP